MKLRDQGLSKYVAQPAAATRISEVAGALGMDAIDLARRCGISRSTYYRRKQKKSACSEQELDLMERHQAVFEQAKRVFEDTEEARLWLNSPQYGLGGKIPIDLVRTTSGFREVEKLLTRIDFGVYA